MKQRHPGSLPSSEKNNQTFEWDAAYPRICTIARLCLKDSRQTLTVINTHFDHVSEEACYRSAQLIAEKVTKLPPKEPVFLTGDFNDERIERWHGIISEVLNDSEIYSPHQVGPDIACTLVTLDSIPKWEDMAKIDYIFINDNVDVIKTTVHTDKFNGYYPSDYFPVSLEYRLKLR